jgi:hypothetical protein
MAVSIFIFFATFIFIVLVGLYIFLTFHNKRTRTVTERFINQVIELGPIVFQNVKLRYWTTNGLKTQIYPINHCDLYLLDNCLAIVRKQDPIFKVFFAPVLLTLDIAATKNMFDYLDTYKLDRITFKQFVKGEIDIKLSDPIYKQYSIDITLKGLTNEQKSQLEKMTMKQTIYIFVLLFLASCEQSKPKQTTTPVTDTIATKYIEPYKQALTEEEKEQPSKFTELEHKLETFSHPDMTRWGGLDGFYVENKLVLIEATRKAELGFLSRTYYINHDSIVKIIYHEHSPEWREYDEKYPPDRFEFDASKMSYSDILYSITLTNPAIFKKQINKKTVSTEINQTLMDKLVHDGQEMKKKLTK